PSLAKNGATQIPQEERQLTFGQSLQRRLIVVSNTKRGDRTRIINARLMDRNERVIYE
ncbi:MAG: hypothetical protein COZ11_02785, partial [Deltaproteobacteria bacterium CG_4_10_14_3_um_filter_51_14]